MDMEVGVVGLGIMGSAMAANLMSAGLSVCGCDPEPEAVHQFRDAGGMALSNAGAVAACAPIVLLSLPSGVALEAVTTEICGSDTAGCIVVECSTLPIDVKEASRVKLSASGVTLLDCPVSGTGGQAVSGDLVILASGDRKAIDRCQHVLNAISRSTHYLGHFGNGMKMKLVANLLVAIHNTSTAEALVLAQEAGLDPKQTFDVIRDGAGSSRMFEIRGSMMIEGHYEPATMKLDVWRKDLDLITDFADGLNCPTPLFSQSEALYSEAEALGLDKQDTAAVKKVLDQMVFQRVKGRTADGD